MSLLATGNWKIRERCDNMLIPRLQSSRVGLVLMVTVVVAPTPVALFCVRLARHSAAPKLGVVHPSPGLLQGFLHLQVSCSKTLQ